MVACLQLFLKGHAAFSVHHSTASSGDVTVTWGSTAIFLSGGARTSTSFAVNIASTPDEGTLFFLRNDSG